jgi:hypothetical protein
MLDDEQASAVLGELSCFSALEVADCGAKCRH